MIWERKKITWKWKIYRQKLNIGTIIAPPPKGIPQTVHYTYKLKTSHCNHTGSAGVAPVFLYYSQAYNQANIRTYMREVRIPACSAIIARHHHFKIPWNGFSSVGKPESSPKRVFSKQITRFYTTHASLARRVSLQQFEKERSRLTAARRGAIYRALRREPSMG